MRRDLTRRLARALLLAAVVAALALALLSVTLALAAEPTGTPNAVLETGDPRSEGGGPGLAGSPLLVLLGVVALGVVTALLTVVIARLSGRPPAGHD